MDSMTNEDNSQNAPAIGLAANRRLGFMCLQQLIDAEMAPTTLLVPKGKSADMWTAKTVDLFERSCGGLVIAGKSFREADGISRLGDQHLDYMISIHFPYIVPQEVLDLPRIGTLNLHPAFLPYNRGWHTPSWAIVDGTPYGATLHWMDAGVDTGDIAMQRQVAVRPGDTADSLYQRVLDAELDLFRDAIPAIATNELPRIPQVEEGTEHRKSDLAPYQALDLKQSQTVGETLKQLRALTTNSWGEAACFEEDGIVYRIRVEMQAEPVKQAERKAA